MIGVELGAFILFDSLHSPLHLLTKGKSRLREAKWFNQDHTFLTQPYSKLNIPIFKLTFLLSFCYSPGPSEHWVGFPTSIKLCSPPTLQDLNNPLPSRRTVAASLTVNKESVFMAWDAVSSNATAHNVFRNGSFSQSFQQGLPVEAPWD